VIYRQHHVHSRVELIRMLRPKALATDGAPAARMNTDETEGKAPQMTTTFAD
jgi:hypothetical protein